METYPLIDIQLDRGTATNQIPVWNDSTKRYVPSVSLSGLTLNSPVIAGIIDASAVTLMTLGGDLTVQNTLNHP